MKQKKSQRLSSSEISGRNALINIMKMILVILQTALFGATWFLFYGDHLSQPFSDLRSWGIIAIYLVLYGMLANVYGGFQVSNSAVSEVAYSLSIAQLLAILFQYFIICLVIYQVVNPVPLLGALGIGIILSILWSILASKMHQSLFPPRRTYIIYDYPESYREIDGIRQVRRKFDVVGIVNISGGMTQVLNKIKDAEAIFICGLHSTDRNRILKYCIEHNIQVYIRPKIGDLLVSGSTQIHIQNMPVLHCGRNRTSLLYQGIKRGIDIVMSGITLVVLSPIMAVVALAIRLYDGGPALYKQTRLTKDGKQFKILKFRSMRVDAEKDGVARLASTNDDRITPIGHFIRKVRLDELPQLINILKGDMSIVGPRPERPEIAAQYEEEMPEFSLRLQVKAGLTGYAQIYGKYNTKPYDKLQMDLIYIANQSIVQDLKLIFVTIKVLFMPESTEGVSEGQVTASQSGLKSTKNRR